MIKKIIFTLALVSNLALPGLLVANVVHAQTPVNVLSGPCSDPKLANSPACKDNATNASADQNPIYGPHGIITTVVKFLSLIVGVVAIFVIVIAGFKFVTSGGDSQSVAEARSSLLYALVGIVVAALGQVLVAFVLDKVK